MKNYVIFREHRSDDLNGEIYVHYETEPKHTTVAVTDKLSDAMIFPTARSAYDWARGRGLEHWHVGAR